MKECIMKSFVIFNPHQILLDNQIKEIQMGGTCGAYGGEEKRIQKIDVQTVRRENSWKTLT